MKKLWGGRFEKGTDKMMDDFHSSIFFDMRLYKQDISGSIAHVTMLGKQGLIPKSDAELIKKTLKEILSDIEDGKIEFDIFMEDIHMNIESILISRIGDVGKKLHTGRSRNDQVSLDIRLYVRDSIHRVVELVRETQRALVSLAERNFELMMPGYTHLQRAQPVLLAHHLLAFYEMLKRDRERLQESIKRVNILPLGSAALAGSTFNLDREMVAKDLAFDGISENSMDAVSDRDFVLEFLFEASLLMMHLSRLSEELVVWSSQEFGFVTISDAFCTGSSIMPQKKNPDVPELIRGKTGRVYGHLISLLTTMKALPLTYNKDMQEDKEALFDAVDTVEICLMVMSRLLSALSFNGERLRGATEKGFLVATDLADYLVQKGMTFREAHGVVGRMVLFVTEKGKELGDLPLDEMKRFSGVIDQDVYKWLDPASCINKRNIPGGTGPDVVKKSIERAKEELKG